MSVRIVAVNFGTKELYFEVATYSQTWDLACFFPGGSESPQFERFLADLTEDIKRFEERVSQAEAPQTLEAGAAWSELIVMSQEIGARLSQASAFAGCLASENTKDEKARLLESRITTMGAAFAAALTHMDHQFLAIPEDVWDALLQTEALKPVAFSLAEARTRAAEKLSPDREALITQLSVDGYHAWGDLYDTIVGRIEIPFTKNGETVSLSVGQAFNEIQSADRNVRESLFAAWEKAWGDSAELCAAALNHLAGFRLNVYEKRGWHTILKEPLDVNRMSEATLHAMWEAVEQGKPRLVQYLKRKAKVLGVPALTWPDVTAPLGKETQKVSYDQAAAFILEHFERFSPAMARFSERAFTERWIEAEDRPGKRPGGFCTDFPLSRQTRIFMTFGGTKDNVFTLAHELGHAYHQQVVADLPHLAQQYAMNVAETASTFAEAIVTDAAIQAAQSRTERLTLIEGKLQNAVAFLMNIHARFIFEVAFYDARRKGPLSVEALNHLMLEAQQKAYCGALGSYHPLFWASKLHFYITGVPFYNFPYTFGYLFSNGVYARAMAEGPSFADKYVGLLRDSGRMTVERLAEQHLGVDLTKRDFWLAAVERAVADVDEFLNMTEDVSPQPEGGPAS